MVAVQLGKLIVIDIERRTVKSLPVKGYEVGTVAVNAQDARLVFDVEVSENRLLRREILVCRLDGSGLHRIVENPGGYSPVWSPDGRRITFSEQGGLLAELDVAKKRVRHIPNVKVATGSRLSYTPDGRSIVFGMTRNTLVPGGLMRADQINDSIWRVRRDGKGLRQVVKEDSIDAALSPDGHWLAYDSSQSGRFVNIARFSYRASSPFARLSADPSCRVAWSPDGSKIAYLDDQYRLIVARKNGTHKRVIRKFTSETRPTWLTWSPR